MKQDQEEEGQDQDHRLCSGSEQEKRKTWRVSCEMVSDEGSEDSGDEYARLVPIIQVEM